jgi:hypothetical protein
VGYLKLNSLFAHVDLGGCAHASPCGPLPICPDGCLDLLLCGPGGQSILDATWEADIDGLGANAGGIFAGCDACSVFNGTYILDMLDSHVGCVNCPNGSQFDNSDCFTLSMHAFLYDPGCEDGHWRIFGQIGISGAGASGADFELTGTAADGAVLTLCAGGEVSLPLIALNGFGAAGPPDFATCATASPTLTIRTVY